MKRRKPMLFVTGPRGRGVSKRTPTSDAIVVIEDITAHIQEKLASCSPDEIPSTQPQS